MPRKLSFLALPRVILYGALLVTISLSVGAKDRILLDFNMKTEPPADWAVEGYAFGTRNPVPDERQKYALATQCQRYVKKGRMTSPPFTIESDYLRVHCAGTYHPTKMAVVLQSMARSSFAYSWTMDRLNCSPTMGPLWLPTSPCQIHETEASAYRVRAMPQFPC